MSDVLMSSRARYFCVIIALGLYRVFELIER